MENLLARTFDLTHETAAFDTTVETNSHVYKSLKSQTNQTRLIEILPEDEDGRIRCRTHVCDLSSKPRYVALSYTWGSPPAQHLMELDGEDFWIRKNLWRFLKQVRKLKAFAAELFWIDAICINQKDLAERTQQVGLMPHIYKGAYKVLAWLGPTYDNSNDAMDYMSKPISAVRNKSAQHQVWSRASGQSISELCARQYWKRLWIFQELYLAQQVDLMCGGKIIKWTVFQEVLLTTSDAMQDNRLRERLALINTADSPAHSIVTQISQDANERSLFSLILATRELRCAEARDKVYGLLGVATTGHSGIVADYNLPTEILLNRVLRELHATQTPESINIILQQCHSLTECMGVGTSSIFKLSESYEGQFPVPPDSEIGFSSESYQVSAKRLLWAAFYDHKPIVQLVAQDLIRSGFFRKLFRQSVGDGKETIAMILLEIDVQVKALQQSDKEKALLSAASSGYSRIVQSMIYNETINLNTNIDNLGRTALHDAINFGRTAIATMLLSTDRVNINLQDMYGDAVLHSAVQNNRMELLTALLKTGRVDVNLQNLAGDTALHQAARRGYLEVVRVLLDDPGVDANLHNSDRKVVLHEAVSREQTAIVNMLLKSDKVAVNSQDRSGKTALHIASARGSRDTALAIINKARKIDVNVQDNTGLTALHVVAEKGDISMVTALLSTDMFNVNVQSTGGSTALHHTAWHGHTAAFTALLGSNKCNVNLKDKAGNTVLHQAAYRGYVAITVVLLDSGKAYVNAQNAEGWTALHYAVERQNAVLATALLGISTVDVNIQTYGGMTALHLAVAKGNAKAAAALLSTNKVDLDLKNAYGQTALEMAVTEREPLVARAISNYKSGVARSKLTIQTRRMLADLLA